MKSLALLLLTVVFFCSCEQNESVEDKTDITSKFCSTWNIHESMEQNDDGSITYQALPWGGLVADVKENNMGVDWSDYESITVEFAEPTTVTTQIMISDELKALAKPGISTLTCYFDGYDVKYVDEIAIQADDTSTLVVKSVRLTPADATWERMNIWKGDCVMGNWENGFVVNANQFADVNEGDKLEIVFTADKENPNTYWLLKTIYNTTDQTLEGNNNELNDWGCVLMGAKTTTYRIVLTANDVNNLRNYGLFVNGFYCNVTQCNVLRKHYKSEEE